MNKIKVNLIAKKKPASPETSAFFKAYTQLSPKIKKIKKKDDIELLKRIIKDMNALLNNL